MKNKKIIKMNKIILLFILIAGLVLFYYVKTNTDRKNIAFLNEHGWEVNRKGYNDKKRTRQDIDHMINLLKMLSIYEDIGTKLSEIGIKLNEEELDKVKTYSYYLEQYGIDEPLRAHVWVSKGKIVFSYIEPLDVHIKVYFWPINYGYEEIKRELFKNREEVLEEHNK